ncbi:transcriptional regulator [Gordonia terrae]|uniref:Transcriptional regulator n=1 Tax=Gordonia terrae TaxID=2055 RepID=A0A2I1R1H1_9ACTN|nr:transcriptional regulator [Gordonia terrae]
MTPRRRADKIERRDLSPQHKVRRLSRKVIRGFDPKALTDLRRSRGLSPGELGRVAGVSENAIRYWESSTSSPQIDKLVAVLRVLEAPVSAVVAIDRSEALLSDLRILAGLTQPELAAAAGIPTSTLAALERGHRPLSESSAGALAVALGVTGDDFRAAYERTRTQPPRITRS